MNSGQQAKQWHRETVISGANVLTMVMTDGWDNSDDDKCMNESAYLTCDSYLGGADIVCDDDDIKLGALRLNESSSSWTISAATESHFQYHNYKATYCFDFKI